MKNEREHLTITEIKHCEKCTDICHKMAIGGAIFTGISFLTECITAGIITVSDMSTLGKFLALLGSTVFMGLGFAACEFSHEALKTSEELNEMLENERYQIYYEGKSK